MKRPFFLLAAALAIFGMHGCTLLQKDLQPPTVELIGLQPASAGTNAPLRLISRLRLSNPNDADLPVKDGQLSLELNGSQVATTRLEEKFTIPANDSIDVDIGIDIDLWSAVSLGLGLLNQSSPAIDWRLHGHIDLVSRYLGRVKVSESGKIDIGQLLSQPTQNR